MAAISPPVSPPTGPTPRRPTEVIPLHEQLDRWVRAGLIEASQATQIEAAEATRLATPAPATPKTLETPATPATARAHPARVPVAERARRQGATVAEGLGYIGGALAVIAAFLALRDLWQDASTAAELTFAATGMVVLLAAGSAMRGREAAAARLRATLWLLSTACLGAFAALLGERVWEWSGESTGLLTAAAVTGYGLALWLRSAAAPQQIAVFAGVAGMLAFGLASLAGAGEGTIGTAIWTLSVAWGAAAYRELLAPPRTGMVLAGVGLVFGAQLLMVSAAGHLLGLGTVVLLVGAGIATRSVGLLGVAAVDVVLTVPRSAARYLPQSGAAPMAIFAVGIVLLGLAWWLSVSGGGFARGLPRAARGARSPRPRQPGERGG